MPLWWVLDWIHTQCSLHLSLARRLTRAPDGPCTLEFHVSGGKGLMWVLMDPHTLPITRRSLSRT